LQPFLDQRFVRESKPGTTGIIQVRKEKVLQHRKKGSKLRGTVNSPVVSSAQMRDAENAAFARGISGRAPDESGGQRDRRDGATILSPTRLLLIFSGKGNTAAMHSLPPRT